MRIDKSILGVAGEFAVAAELCRRNIYAQLTLGNQKRVDLLTLSRTGRFLKIEVKAKQDREWPGVKGLPPGNGFLVFVDFAAKRENDRPDFFILSPDDWYVVATRRIAEYQSKHPGRSAHLNEANCPVHPEEVNAHGKPFQGCSIRVGDIEQYREAWSKIISASSRVTEVNPE